MWAELEAARLAMPLVPELWTALWLGGVELVEAAARAKDARIQELAAKLLTAEVAVTLAPVFPPSPRPLTPELVKGSPRPFSPSPRGLPENGEGRAVTYKNPFED